MGVVAIILTAIYDVIDFFIDRVRAGKCFICNALSSCSCTRCACMRRSPSPKLEFPEHAPNVPDGQQP